jgi:hypothetical protein
MPAGECNFNKDFEPPRTPRNKKIWNDLLKDAPIRMEDLGKV